MGATSISHWIVLLIVILVIFGAGKIPSVMGDIGKGIKNFKHALNDDKEKKENGQDNHK